MLHGRRGTREGHEAASLSKQRGTRKGKRAVLGAPHREEEDGGPGDAHARALGGDNDARPAGTGESCRGPTPGEGKKSGAWATSGGRLMGRLLLVSLK
jgi:hypothetical protein